MDTTATWLVPMLGAVVALGAIASYSAYRVWVRRARLTLEERCELAATPMPKLQKRALFNTAIGLIALGVLSAILTTYGAAAYWDNDDLRLTMRFHDQGAVPMVYLYLMFGTVVLVSLIGHSAGIVVGYWMGSSFGES